MKKLSNGENFFRTLIKKDIIEYVLYEFKHIQEITEINAIWWDKKHCYIDLDYNNYSSWNGERTTTLKIRKSDIRKYNNMKERLLKYV